MPVLEKYWSFKDCFIIQDKIKKKTFVWFYSPFMHVGKCMQIRKINFLFVTKLLGQKILPNVMLLNNLDKG